MSIQQSLNLEALKLVKDWSIWMVTVQTAVIAFLVRTGGPTKVEAANFIVPCFAASILAAAWVLSAIPYDVIRLSGSDDPNIYFMKLSSAPILKLIPLWVMAAIQHLFFAFGIIALAIWAIHA